MRWSRRVLVIALCASLACEKAPVAPPGNGGLALSIEIEASSSAARVDDGIVHVRGPTDVDVSIAPGETKTITQLAPGSYTVSLEGLSNGEVELFGQRSLVRVVAGENTPVTVTLGSFVPVLQTLPATSRDEGFTVNFGAVAGAASYLVEWDTAAGFSTAQSTSITGTSVTIPIAGFGRYYVRLRAVSEFDSRWGRASDPGGPIEVLLAFETISAGGFHTCGVTTGGAAYCWGNNGDGQLGVGTGYEPRLVPTPVAGGLSFDAVSAGRYHTCGLTRAGGAVYCWGDNNWAQVGDGTRIPRAVPTPVAGGLSFDAVSAGESHTCGVLFPMAFCWGDNELGQIGDGTTNLAFAPTRVTDTDVDYPFAVVSAGRGHTCGLAEGHLYCWGHNFNGQLGDSTTTDRLVPTPARDYFEQEYPIVSAGGFHTCAVTFAGDVHCWGGNGLGQLGDSTTTDRLVPAPVAGALSFDAVSAGSSHTCGLTPGGAAYCWGGNTYGKLGDNTTTGRLVPTPVAGGLSLDAVSAGSSHTCGLTPGGAAYCWGYNGFGQLGDNTATHRSVPARVAGT